MGTWTALRGSVVTRARLDALGALGREEGMWEYGVVTHPESRVKVVGSAALQLVEQWRPEFDALTLEFSH